MAKWEGYKVSIKCNNNNSYQGEIESATNQEIILQKAFCNGVPSETSRLQIKGKDIVDIKFLDTKQDSTNPQRTSTVPLAKPIPKHVDRTPVPHSTTVNDSNRSFHLNNSTTTSGNKVLNFSPLNKTDHPSGFSKVSSTSTPLGPNCSASGRKKKFKRNGGTGTGGQKATKNEECFDIQLGNIFDKEFDFETNLALFDKQALWDELNSGQQQQHILNGQSTNDTKTDKYRHNENVIAGVPITHRQIIVPKQDICEYVTDEGLIIPSISYNLRKRILDVCDRVGFNVGRRLEIIGRATADISIQLLGGARRLDPSNSHQWPTVVILSGPNTNGAMGLNAARQLAGHGIKTITLIVPCCDNTKSIVVNNELNLYKLTGNQVVSEVGQLPKTVDLIILALCDDGEGPQLYINLADWANRIKATVLALDPPVNGTVGFHPKYTLVPILPMSHSSRNGKLYLCNLGIPLNLFKEVGIKYYPPFGPKSVIPLYRRDD